MGSRRLTDSHLNRLLRCGNKSIVLLAASQLGEGLMINKAKLAPATEAGGETLSPQIFVPTPDSSPAP
jgi:hypothetical protein